MSRYPALVAALLAALTVGLVVTLFLVDPVLADVLTREGGVVEWLQAGLFGAAAVFALRGGWAVWRAGGSPVVGVLVAALLGGLIIGEIDLDRILFGRKIIYTRFLVDDAVWLGWRVLAAVVMAAPPVALALYALWRRTELTSAARRALVEPSGRVLLAGLVLFGLTEVFERPLGQVPGLPRYMVEEVLELVAAICLSVALYARAGETKG